MAYFQELISHWSLTFHSNGLQHHGGLGLSFPKWYDTCIFVEKWLHNSPKFEVLRFWSKFWQNFSGIFGAFKTLFGATKGIDGCPLMGIEGFWRQKLILRTSFDEYQILTLSRFTPWLENSMLDNPRIWASKVYPFTYMVFWVHSSYILIIEKNWWSN